MKRIIVEPHQFQLSPTEIILTPDQSHYLFRILRLQNGDDILVLDGAGKSYKGIIDQKKIVLGECVLLSEPASRKICLAQVIPKGKKMDWILQKSTEMGINHIIPLYSQRSNVPTISKHKFDRWLRQVREASRQCGRALVPTLSKPLPIMDWLSSPIEYETKVTLWEKADRNDLSVFQKTSSSLLMVIGSEGGFSDDEINAFSRTGFTVAHMGPRILRTETAAVVALSIIQYLQGELRFPPSGSVDPSS